MIAERKDINLKEARKQLDNSELESLDVVEIVMQVEEEFGIAVDD